MQKATVKNIQGNGDFQAHGKTFHSFEVTLTTDEGEVFGTANSLSNPPKWKVGDTVWFKQAGEHEGVAKLKVSTQDPAESNHRADGNYRAENPDTVKRIECSWGIQTAISLLGPIGQTEMSEDDYLKRVYEIAPRLLKLRNTLMA